MTQEDFVNKAEETGFPVFYGFAPAGTRVPFIVITFDSNNSFADNYVFAKGYSFNLRLYSKTKDLSAEQTIEEMFESNCITWERTESINTSERIFIQDYLGEFI